MAYVKTVWETGDVITAAKLNNAEDGIEAHDPIILEGTWVNDDTGCNFDISPEDMIAAFYAGKTIVCHYPAQSTQSFKEGYGIISYVYTTVEDDVTSYAAEDTLCAKHFGVPSLTSEGYSVSFGMG